MLNRKISLACLPLIILALGCPAHGNEFDWELVIDEDFGDGDILDDDPVSWFFYFDPNIEVDDNHNCIVWGGTQDGWGATSRLEGIPAYRVTNSAIEGQIRLEGTPEQDFIAGFMLRAGSPQDFTYLVISNTGELSFGRRAPWFGNWNPNTMETDFRPLDEDVMLRFEIMGSELRAYLWRPGEPRPQEPIMTAEDTVYDDYPVGNFAITGNTVGGGTAIFRWVKAWVAVPQTLIEPITQVRISWFELPGEEHIPESAPTQDGPWTPLEEPIQENHETGEKWVFVEKTIDRQFFRVRK